MSQGHDPFDWETRAQLDAEQAQRAKLLGLAEEADIKWLMSGKRGRRVVRRLLSRAGALDQFPSSFNTNAATMAFNEGRRAEANMLREKIMAYALDEYFLMLKERDDNAQ